MVKWISLGVMTLILAQNVFAVTETSPYYNPQRLTYTKKIKEKKKVSAKGFSAIIPSVVVHGMRPEENASAVMPRKLDEGGRTVVTPGFGLQYVSDSGLLVIGAVVKDCYDNLAGTLQVGELFELSDRTNWGLTMGVYARQTPMACETSSNGFTSTTSCYDIDSYRMKFNASVNGHPVDIIPMPFLHLTTALYKSREFELDVKVMSNFVLNEFGISVPF